MQGIDQHPLDKFGCGKSSEAAVKANYMQAVDAQVAQSISLLTQAGETGGCVGRGKKFARMWLKTEDAGRQIARTRDVLQARQHGLMPHVQAIEITDSDGVLDIQGIETVGDAHAV